MAQSSKVFRIFVSSTFSDMKEERSALQQRVFPKLRKLCMKYGCRFQPIDLRWGLSTEAGLDQQTMKICLEEIKRCQRISPKPNFIVLLGDRYGWRPLPYQIPVEEYNRIIIYIENEEDKKLIQQWYIKDENAIEPVYCLQPRKDEFADQSAWDTLENRMRRILLYAVSKAGFNPEERTNYSASATEQEIERGALSVEDAKEHVFGFFRSIGNLPQDKSAKDFIDLNADGSVDREAQELLHQLKNVKLRNTLDNNIHEYEAVWEDGKPSTSHIEALCEDVEKQLTQVILGEIDKLMDISPLEMEISSHSDFCTERASMFQGREEYLSKINSYLGGSDTRPLILFGESGTGKSALMAKSVQETARLFPDAKIISRFIGASSDSSEIRLLLKGICLQIAHTYALPEPATDDYNSLTEVFGKMLKQTPADKPVYIFIDSLDQLTGEDSCSSFPWVPDNLSGSNRLVLSTLPGDCFESLKKRWNSPNLMKLNQMSDNDGLILLESWLQNAGRTLRGDQKKEIVEKFKQCPLPLYLKLAFNEACRWRSFDILKPIGSNIPEMIQNMLLHLSDRINHGSLLVSKCLGYIAASRHGLSEDEIIDLLSGDDILIKDYEVRSFHALPERKLPVVVWSRLYLDLEPYLTERSSDETKLFTFYHRQIREKITELYCAGENSKAAHAHLAHYFSELPLWKEADGKRAANARKVSELPYQLTHAGMTEQLESILTNLDFIEAKSSVELYDLITDYDRIGAGRSMTQKGNYAVSKDLSEFGDFVRKNAHVFSLHADAVFQQAMNSPDKSAPASKAQELMKIRGSDRPWLRWKNRPQQTDSLIMTITGFIRGVDCCAWSPDGSRIISWCNSINATSFPALWDSNTGRMIANLPEQEGYIKGCVFSSDSTKILAAFSSGSAKLLNAETGKTILLLECHKVSVNACALSHDDRQAALALEDGTLEVWDLKSQSVIAVLKSEFNSATCCSYSPDGNKLAVGLSSIKTSDKSSNKLGNKSDNLSVVIWDTRRWKTLCELDACEYGGVRSCSFSPDGNRLVAASYSSEIRVWDTSKYNLIYNARTEGFAPDACIYSPDGTQIAVNHGWGFGIYEADNFSRRNFQPGHSGQIHALAYSPDGKKLVTAAGDNTMKIWDTGKSGLSIEPLRQINGINNCAYSAAAGRVLTSTISGLSSWDVSQSLHLADTSILISHDTIFKFLNDGQHAIVVETSDHSIIMIDMLTSEVKATFSGHKSYINSADLSPDGQRIVSASMDNTMSIWDVESHTIVAAVDLQPNEIKYCRFSPDGRTIITLNQGTDIQVWDAENARQISVFPSSGASKFRFSADGEKIITYGHETIRFIDTKTGTICKEKREPQFSLDIKDVSPDGQNMIIEISQHRHGGVIAKLVIMDTSGLNETIPIMNNVLSDVGSIAKCGYTPDGNYILISLHDGTIRVYSTSGKLLSVFSTGDRYGASFTFALNYKTIITGDQAGTTYFLELVNLPTGLPVATAVRRYSFRKKEWESDAKVRCEWCGSDVIPEDQKPMVQCSSCGNKIRLTPFFVDSSHVEIKYTQPEQAVKKSTDDEGIKDYLRFKAAQNAIKPGEQIILNMLESGIHYDDIDFQNINNMVKNASDKPSHKNEQKEGIWGKLFGKKK